MRALLLATAALLVTALAAPPGAVAGRPAVRSQPRPRGAAATDLSAKRKAKRHRRVSRSGQIACTPLGCHRIPPNCHPETDYYWNGLPTGFDRVVCR